jgi:hypothetical protein
LFRGVVVSRSTVVRGANNEHALRAFFGLTRSVIVHALEATAWSKEAHLRARVKLGAALGAATVEPDIVASQVSALRTADDVPEAGHVDVLGRILGDSPRSGGGARLRAGRGAVGAVSDRGRRPGNPVGGTSCRSLSCGRRADCIPTLWKFAASE